MSHWPEVDIIVHDVYYESGVIHTYLSSKRAILLCGVW